MATRNQIKELAQNYLDAGDLESTEILLGMIESGEYEDETTTAGLAFETAKAIPRGFGKGLLSSGAGLAGLRGVFNAVGEPLCTLGSSLSLGTFTLLLHGRFCLVSGWPESMAAYTAARFHCSLTV